MTVYPRMKATHHTIRTDNSGERLVLERNHFEELRNREFPAVQCLGFGALTAVAQVQSLVRELRS